MAKAGDRKHDVFGDGTPYEGLNEVDVDKLSSSVISSVEASLAKPKRHIHFNPSEGDVHRRERNQPWRLDGNRKLAAINQRAEEEQWEKRRIGLAKQVHDGLLHNYNVYVGIAEVANVLKIGQDQRRMEKNGHVVVANKDIAAAALLVAAEKYDLPRVAVLLGKVPAAKDH